MSEELTAERVRKIADRKGGGEVNCAPVEELARALARFALQREGQIERLHVQLEQVRALLARWEDEANKLREPMEPDIVKDESGEIWPDSEWQTEYVMLTSHARELRAVLDRGE